jgi:N,N'-diacetyllegionaminate synthase
MSRDRALDTGGVRLRPERRPFIEIAGRLVGIGHPLFTIAEIGLNHGGSLERAVALVDAAADAGASAVKLQTVIASELVSADAPAPAHVRATSMREFFATFELDEAAHRRLVGRARARGLAVIATPLSESAVDLLNRVGVDAMKIASGDLTWDRLIRRCAATGRPLVMSTGMAALTETRHALASARAAGARHVALMHCVSAYPVPEGSENLRAITTLARSFRVPVGLSDHGADGFALPLAVALGASLYERHIMLTAGDGSIDAGVSSTGAELRCLIRAAARARGALGDGAKSCLPAEAVNRMASRRGLYTTHALPIGHVVSAADVIALRPAAGLDLNRQQHLIGARLERRIESGSPFMEADLRNVVHRAIGVEHGPA